MKEMKDIGRKNRVQIVLDTLHLSASALARASGVDTSLINKWRRGERQVTSRSAAALAAARALVELDGQARLVPLYAPYRGAGGDAEALLAYLMDEDLPGLGPRAGAPRQQTSGEYTAEHAVYLGQRGFRKAVLAMLDYVQLLPPGQTIVVVAQGRFEWFVKNIPFLLVFLGKLKKAFARGTRLLLVNRKGYNIADVAAFAGPWVAAHMAGHIRSLYYEGQPPHDEVRFLGCIRGYWSGRAEEDPDVEDSLYASMTTDPRQTKRDAALCDAYIAQSVSVSQYGFLRSPQGDAENPRLWRAGPLPPWGEGARPDGSFYATARVPGLGMMTREEVASVAGGDALPGLPEYLFGDGGFHGGPYRILLCREEVQSALRGGRRTHEALSALLHRPAYVPRGMLAAQLGRLVKEMEQRDDFEVALVPQTAFRKLQLEMVCWKDSVTVGWLQDMSESVYSVDRVTSGSFRESIGYAWSKLLVGWKRKATVLRTLRKWLAGRELDESGPDSAQVKNWDVLPRE